MPNNSIRRLVFENEFSRLADRPVLKYGNFNNIRTIIEYRHNLRFSMCGRIAPRGHVNVKFYHPARDLSSSGATAADFSCTGPRSLRSDRTSFVSFLTPKLLLWLFDAESLCRFSYSAFHDHRFPGQTLGFHVWRAEIRPVPGGIRWTCFAFFFFLLSVKMPIQLAVSVLYTRNFFYYSNNSLTSLFNTYI